MSRRDIPPGHTKPPIRSPGLPSDIKQDWARVDPRRIPRAAKGVLIFAMVMAFVINLMGDQMGVATAIVAVIAAGAFGEAMRAHRDAQDATRATILIPSIAADIMPPA